MTGVPDPDLLLVQRLTPLMGGVRVVTELPEPLPAPIVVVDEIPGGTHLGDARLDVCLFSYDAYAVGREAARELAETVRQHLIDAPLWDVDGPMWVVQAQIGRPTALPYDDETDIRRFGGTGRVWLRYRRPA